MVDEGYKSAIKAVDLEFTRNEVRHFIAIKSGPYWGNKAQKEKLNSDFRTVKQTLGTGRQVIPHRFINGCCYGNDNCQVLDYEKMCGQRFWHFISGENDLYLEFIEPLGHNAQARTEEFLTLRNQKIVDFTQHIYEHYVREGSIDWVALLIANSGDHK